MTKARNIADLLDANGDVKSSSLDNVPASNDASALTTGTIADARLPATALNSNVDLTTLSASNLTSGTLADARFPSTLPAVSGANLTSLPASGATTALYQNDVTSFTSSVNIDGYFDDALYRGYELYMSAFQPDGTSQTNYLSIALFIDGSLSSAGEMDSVGTNIVNGSSLSSTVRGQYNTSPINVYPVDGTNFNIAGNAGTYPNDTNAGKISIFNTEGTFAKNFSCFFFGDTRSGGSTDSTHMSQSAISCKFGSSNEVTGFKIYWGNGANIKGRFKLIGINK